jgi:hypothetical protein
MARATELVGKKNKKKIKRRERKEDESKVKGKGGESKCSILPIGLVFAL